MDDEITQLLNKRDGLLTILKMKDGKQYRVYNIAWGRDKGAECDHITTNISPAVEGESIDFFHTNEVDRVEDPYGIAIT